LSQNPLESPFPGSRLLPLRDQHLAEIQEHFLLSAGVMLETTPKSVGIKGKFLFFLLLMQLQ